MKKPAGNSKRGMVESCFSAQDPLTPPRSCLLPSLSYFSPRPHLARNPSGCGQLWTWDT